MKRFTKEAQLEVVKKVISGELLPNEAMSTYNIQSKKSLVRWIRKHHAVARRLLEIEEAAITVEEKVSPIKTGEVKESTVHFLHEVINMHEHILQLKRRVAAYQEQQEQIIDELNHLKMEIKQLKKAGN